MRKLIAALCCTLLVAPALALAQDKGQVDAKKAVAAEKKEGKKEPSEKQKARQQKMKDCNKQAADKKMKGDERKGFMSSCLKG
jgi:hypothetical protein